MCAYLFTWEIFHEHIPRAYFSHQHSKRSKKQEEQEKRKEGHD